MICTVLMPSNNVRAGDRDYGNAELIDTRVDIDIPESLVDEFIADAENQTMLVAFRSRFISMNDDRVFVEPFHVFRLGTDTGNWLCTEEEYLKHAG